MVSVKVKHLRALEGLRAEVWQQEGFTPAKKIGDCSTSHPCQRDQVTSNGG